MNQALNQAIALLDSGHRRNRTIMVGFGVTLVVSGLLAFLLLDPEGLGRYAYFGRFLLAPMGVVCIALPYVRRPKALTVLKERPEQIARWEIARRGQGLPLTFSLTDGSTVSQDLNVYVARRLKPLLAQALPAKASGSSKG